MEVYRKYKLLNAVLPFWHKKYKLTQPLDKIRKNFGYIADEAYIILMSGDNDKEYYGIFVDDEFFLRRRFLGKRSGPTVKCKVTNTNEVYYADITIGFRYWEFAF